MPNYSSNFNASTILNSWLSDAYRFQRCVHTDIDGMPAIHLSPTFMQYTLSVDQLPRMMLRPMLRACLRASSISLGRGSHRLLAEQS